MHRFTLSWVSNGKDHRLRRLGYPLHLVQNKMHLFVRWEDKNERLNIEATSQGIVCRNDEYFANWPEPLSPSEKASGAYLRNLDRSEELSVFLNARGNCLEDNGRYPESHVAYAMAHAIAPQMPNSILSLALSVARENPGVRNLFASSRRGPNRRPAIHDPLVHEMNERNRQMLEVGHSVPSVPSPIDQSMLFGPRPNQP